MTSGAGRKNKMTVCLVERKGVPTYTFIIAVLVRCG